MEIELTDFPVSMEHLVRAARTGKLAFSVDRLEGSTRDLVERVFTPDIIAGIDEVGYLGGLEVPWLVEELYLYSLSELEEKQAGYRFDLATSAAIPGWDQQMYVIADWTGDPVAVDAGGALWTARHGQGAWTFVRIAENLPQFQVTLALWIEYFVVKGKKRLLDDNSVVIPEERKRLSEEVLASLREEEKNGFLTLLGI